MPPRVIYHLIQTDGFYGAERVILDLCMAIDKDRYRPVVSPLFETRRPNLDLYDAARDVGIETHLIKCSHQLDPGVVQHLRSLVSTGSVELFHCHGFKADFYGALLKALTGFPVVATRHGWTASTPIIRFYEKVDSSCLRCFDHIAAVSEPIRHELMVSGVPSHRISVIPNGINFPEDHFDESRSRMRDELGLGDADTAIGCIARLSPEKGHECFLRAAVLVNQNFPSARFLFFGEGPLRSMLEHKAMELGLGTAVTFAGHRKDMAAVYPALDLVASASFREGLPMSLLEAMAYIRPVVATRVGDVPNVVHHGKTGALVEPGDEVGLAQAILSLITDPGRAMVLAAKGRELVRTEYGAIRMACQYAELYDRVFGKTYKANR